MEEKTTRMETKVWYGLVWNRKAWCGLVWKRKCGVVWYGNNRLGMVWYGNESLMKADMQKMRCGLGCYAERTEPEGGDGRDWGRTDGSGGTDESIRTEGRK